jgi:DNA-binding SARP family transcriptional activator
MTDFRLLGPLEAVEGGEPLPLPAGKPRALLARLLLDAGHVVAVETLVDGLWGERAPASANKLLQVYVSQLRKALGRDAIETRRPGYLVRVEEGRYDLARFEALTEAARETADPARRADMLGEALSLSRGPALAEFRAEPFARAAARRVAELRLAAVEQRIDAELELGQHERVIGELEGLVEQEPLRERPRRQLMLALYRSGREAEALARYREGRRLLVDELGIEPTPALQKLERAILRRDPALAEPRPQRAPARGSVVCVGAHLHALLAPLCAHERELLVVELAASPVELRELSARLERLREELVAGGVDARAACFTSDAPGDDLLRLAAEQDAVLVVSGPLAPDAQETLLAAAPCDVALAPRVDLEFSGDGPVLVPFGGAREEWAALELGAWVARAHGLQLRLLGTEASDGRRDASRMLAGASLALQRFAGTAAEPVIVPAGVEGILAERASLVVASLPAGELDPTRRALVERSAVPVLLVRAGLRPGGLAPDETLTRFSWSLREAT